VRRPLLVAFVLGCSVSLMTSGRVTLRLAGPATVHWSFVPLAGIAGLAVVSGRRLHAETIDEFFHGYLPWMLLSWHLRRCGLSFPRPSRLPGQVIP
jgi:hypothetical protein